MAFIGNTNTTQAFTPAIDYFSGNGSTTAFTLSRPIASVAQVQVVVNNVAQNPSSAYTVSGNTITFTSAPSSGTNNIYVYYTSPITQVIAPGQNTVYPSSLSTTNALYWDTSGNVGIGTSSPSSYANYTALTINGTDVDIDLLRSGTRQFGLYTTSALTAINNVANLPLYFYTNNTSRMILDTSGNLQFNSGYGSVATAYGCRAWVNFNGTGTVAIRASGNVTSITDNGVGDYTVNFTTAMPDANYAVTGTAGDYTGGTQNRMTVDPKVYATGSIRFNVDNSSSTTDQNAVSVAIFR